MRAANKPVQRKGVHVRVVLAGVRVVRELLRPVGMGDALLLLERALPVRQVPHRAHATRVALAQVHLQGLRLPLLAARRLSGAAPHRHELVRPRRLGAHQRALAQVHREVSIRWLGRRRLWRRRWQRLWWW